MDGKTFITINGEKLSIMDVFSLMLLLDGFELRESMRNHFGIIEFAASKNIYPEKEQIQEALDELRYDWGMEKSSNFQEWCKKNNITENSLYLVSKINACQRLILNSFTEELSQEFKNYVADETILLSFLLTTLNSRTSQSPQWQKSKKKKYLSLKRFKFMEMRKQQTAVDFLEQSQNRVTKRIRGSRLRFEKGAMHRSCDG